MSIFIYNWDNYHIDISNYRSISLGIFAYFNIVLRTKQISTRIFSCNLRNKKLSSDGKTIIHRITYRTLRYNRTPSSSSSWLKWKLHGCWRCNFPTPSSLYTLSTPCGAVRSLLLGIYWICKLWELNKLKIWCSDVQNYYAPITQAAYSQVWITTISELWNVRKTDDVLY